MRDATRWDQAARAVARAEALLIGAGAGMGVDSGLPDFRGNQGFWQAYPPYARLGLGFTALANPRWFRSDPTLAWGFYGHRLNLYRTIRPHDGFQILRAWSRRLPGGCFVFTSNVDGHFQVAGFDPQRICEVHGSIHHLQCTRHCGAGIFPADGYQVVIDEETMRAQEPLPACPECGALARPNILMFGDGDWDDSRSHPQERRLNTWLDALTGRFVVIECGAGTAIATVRYLCERVTAAHDAMLIRLNAREAHVPEGHLGLACGALEGLREIDTRLSALQETPCR